MADISAGSLSFDLNIDTKKLDAALKRAETKFKKFGTAAKKSADVDMFTRIRRGLDDVEKRIAKFTKSISNAMGKLGRSFSNAGAAITKFGAAGVAAFAAVGYAVKNLTDLYSVQEDAEAKLEQVIKSTGGAAGVTSQEMKDLASGLQKVTTFGDEAIIGMEALLLTFTNIKGGVLKDATEAVLDLKVGMDITTGQVTDLKSAAIQLGKALNDPIKGLTALSKVGVGFSDKQKKDIIDLMTPVKHFDPKSVILSSSQIAQVKKLMTKQVESIDYRNVIVSTAQRKILDQLMKQGKYGIQRAKDITRKLAIQQGRVTYTGGNPADIAKANAIWQAAAEKQGKLITEAVDQSKVIKAQRIILDEINKQFGGQARKRLETFSGAMENLNNLWGDAKEKMGGVFVPALMKAGEELRKIATEVDTWMLGNGKAISDYILNLTEQMIPLIKEKVTEMWTFLKPKLDELKQWLEENPEKAAEFIVWAGMLTAAAVALGPLLYGLGQVFFILSSIIVTFSTLTPLVFNLLRGALAAINGIKIVLVWLFPFIKGFFAFIIANFVTVLTYIGAGGLIVFALWQVLDIINAVRNNTDTFFSRLFKAHFPTLQNWLNWYYDKVWSIINAIMRMIGLKEKEAQLTSEADRNADRAAARAQGIDLSPVRSRARPRSFQPASFNGMRFAPALAGGYGGGGQNITVNISGNNFPRMSPSEFEAQMVRVTAKALKKSRGR